MPFLLAEPPMQNTRTAHAIGNNARCSAETFREYDEPATISIPAAKTAAEPAVRNKESCPVQEIGRQEEPHEGSELIAGMVLPNSSITPPNHQNTKAGLASHAIWFGRKPSTADCL